MILDAHCIEWCASSLRRSYRWEASGKLIHLHRMGFMMRIGAKVGLTKELQRHSHMFSDIHDWIVPHVAQSTFEAKCAKSESIIIRG